jgi:hypothetical protein
VEMARRACKSPRRHLVAIQTSVRVPEDGDQEKIRNPRKEDVRVKRGN